MRNTIQKNRLCWLVFLLYLVCSGSEAGAQVERCGVDDRRSGIDSEKAIREQRVADWISEHGDGVRSRMIITIPVVVHVVWNTNEENLPDEQILSQIAVLNNDFGGLNVEIPSIPFDFQPFIADTELEFCLARVDPAGQPTNGITRTFTPNSVGIASSTDVHYSNKGGRDAWDPDRYLNIWVAKFAGGVGGTSSFPGVGLPEEDGVVIDYRQFGTLNIDPPYHLGRTCTHEIGHYFNLEHPWGQSLSNCQEDDLVPDTPETNKTYLSSCPTHPATSCGTPDMYMNYMYYTDDACMGMFTEGQKLRMLAAIDLFRPGLLTGFSRCDPVSTVEVKSPFSVVVPNPVRGDIRVILVGNIPNVWNVSVFDLTGRRVAEERFSQTSEGNLKAGHLTSGLYLLSVEFSSSGGDFPSSTDLFKMILITNF